ncbi:hypothetical protein [Sphingomonas sp. NBWT7]|uniref:hypothetical protein n=1 Tax=Sphingomonas sp. NBWT7 TaxID=2596913 RepID=UPI001628E594|nr:hypothetical protein [Sphingomonas sp. NBWT7]
MDDSSVVTIGEPRSAEIDAIGASLSCAFPPPRADPFADLLAEIDRVDTTEPALIARQHIR